MPPKTKKKEMPKTKTTKESQFLKVALTQEEVLEVADELATALDNKTSLAAEKEAVSKAFKSKEAAL